MHVKFLIGKRPVFAMVYIDYKWATGYIVGEDEHKSEDRGLTRNTSRPSASLGPASPLMRKKRKEVVMEEATEQLLSHFNLRNVDALIKLTRNTLEILRKRIHGTSLLLFCGGAHTSYLADFSAVRIQQFPLSSGQLLVCY